MISKYRHFPRNIDSLGDRDKKRVLNAIVLSPVRMSKISGRNVCMPKASMHLPAYFPRNIDSLGDRAKK